MKKFDVPTSNLPLYLKKHIDIEKHPFCDVEIKEINKNKTQIIITPSNRKFYKQFTI